MPELRQARSAKKEKLIGIEKCPTGIRGLDEITYGGLPRGRPTLICGGAGSGKTLLAMEFIVRGIRDYGEPGVFMAFEETEQDLTKIDASLGFDLDDLIRQSKPVVGRVRVERDRSYANRGISLNAILQFLSRVPRRRLTTVFDPAELGIHTGFVS